MASRSPLSSAPCVVPKKVGCVASPAKQSTGTPSTTTGAARAATSSLVVLGSGRWQWSAHAPGKHHCTLPSCTNTSPETTDLCPNLTAALPPHSLQASQVVCTDQATEVGQLYRKTPFNRPIQHDPSNTPPVRRPLLGMCRCLPAPGRVRRSPKPSPDCARCECGASHRPRCR